MKKVYVLYSSYCSDEGQWLNAIRAFEDENQADYFCEILDELVSIINSPATPGSVYSDALDEIKKYDPDFIGNEEFVVLPLDFQVEQNMTDQPSPWNAL